MLSLGVFKINNMSRTRTFPISELCAFVKANQKTFEPLNDPSVQELNPPWSDELCVDLIKTIKEYIQDRDERLEAVLAYLNSALYLVDAPHTDSLESLGPVLRGSLSMQCWTLQILMTARRQGNPLPPDLLAVLESMNPFIQHLFYLLHGDIPLISSPELYAAFIYSGFSGEAELYIEMKERASGVSQECIDLINSIYYLIMTLTEHKANRTQEFIHSLYAVTFERIDDETVFGPALICLNELAEEGTELLSEVNGYLLQNIRRVEHFRCFDRLLARNKIESDDVFRDAILSKLYEFRLVPEVKSVMDSFTATASLMQAFITFAVTQLIQPVRNKEDMAIFTRALSYFISYVKEGQYNDDITINDTGLTEIAASPSLLTNCFLEMKELCLFLLRKGTKKEDIVDHFARSIPEVKKASLDQKLELLIQFVLSNEKGDLYQILEDYIGKLIEELPQSDLDVIMFTNLIKTAVTFIPRLRSIIEQKQAAIQAYLDERYSYSLGRSVPRRCRLMLYFVTETFDSFEISLDDEMQITINTCIKTLSTKLFNSELSPHTPHHDTGYVTTLPQLRRHLTDIYESSGVLNLMKVIEENDERAIKVYLMLFQKLRESFLLSTIYNPNIHFCIHQFIVSHLSRLFRFTLNSETTLKYLEECETSVIHMVLSGVQEIDNYHIEITQSLLMSPLFTQNLAKFKLHTENLQQWSRNIFFVPLVRAHGITVFGGSILVNSIYSGLEPYARCGFMLTLLHECAHLLRRTQHNYFDDAIRTPTLKPNEATEVYEKGMPGVEAAEKQHYKTDGEPGHGEGGYQSEVNLFGMVITELNKDQIDFLTNFTNWQYTQREMLRGLQSLGRKKASKRYGYRTDDIMVFPRDNHSSY